MNNNIARFVGPASAGLVVGWFGLIGVVVADAASYLVAAALIWLIATPASPARAADTSQEATVGAAASFVAVWREWL